MQQLCFAGLDLQHAECADVQGFTDEVSFNAALRLIAHAAPETRLAAVQLLSAVGQQLGRPAGRKLTAKGQARVDLVFQKLCGVVSTDTWAAIRLQALAGLSGLQHASLSVRRQALSKRATYSSIAHDTAAADGSLLDSATGAFVHGTEDDVEQVRLATIAAMHSLGDNDQQFADEAAIILISCVSDELLEVRKAALKVLLQWAAAFQQQYMQARQQRLQQGQQQQQQQEQQEEDTEMHNVQQHQQQQGHGAAIEQGINETQLSGADDDEQEEGEWQQQQQQQQEDEVAFDPIAPGAASNAPQPAKRQSPAAAAAAAKPQRGGRKASKKRRGDTPPWGPDALTAAVSAMHDRDPGVRQLALQLALLLPPNGVQAVMGLLQGMLDCCERFRGQHMDVALQVIRQMGKQRAVYVGLAAAKIIKLLAKVTDTAAAAAAAASGSSRGSLHSCLDSHGIQLLHEVLSTAATVRPQITQVVLQQLEQLDSHQQEVHQSLVRSLQQQKQQQEQQ